MHASDPARFGHFQRETSQKEAKSLDYEVVGKWILYRNREIFKLPRVIQAVSYPGSIRV